MDIRICDMTGLAQFVFINLYVYLKTGSNWSTCEYKMKTSPNQFLEVNILTGVLLTSGQSKIA